MEFLVQTMESLKQHSHPASVALGHMLCAFVHEFCRAEHVPLRSLLLNSPAVYWENCNHSWTQKCECFIPFACFCSFCQVIVLNRKWLWIIILFPALVYLDSLYHLGNLHFSLSLYWLPIHACDFIACSQRPIQSCGGVIKDLWDIRDQTTEKVPMSSLAK